MSSYFSSLTGISVSDINKGLTALSNIVAPIGEDEELEGEASDDIRDLASTISAVGDIVKTSIMSGSLKPKISPIILPDNSFDEISLSSSSPSSPEAKSYNSNSREINDSFDWSPVPPAAVVTRSSANSQKQPHIAALNSAELEKNVQSKYLGRVEGELEKLTMKVKILEAENKSLKGPLLPTSSTLPARDSERSETSGVDSGKIEKLQRELEVALRRIDELEKIKVDSDARTDAMVCRLINEQDALERAITEKDAVIASMLPSSVKTKDSTVNDSSESSMLALQERILTLEEANARLIEGVQELEQVVSVSKAECAELIFALEIEKRKSSDLLVAETEYKRELTLMKENEISLKELVDSLQVEERRLVEQLQRTHDIDAAFQALKQKESSRENDLFSFKNAMDSLSNDLDAARYERDNALALMGKAEEEHKRELERLKEALSQHAQIQMSIDQEAAAVEQSELERYKRELTACEDQLQVGRSELRTAIDSHAAVEVSLTEKIGRLEAENQNLSTSLEELREQLQELQSINTSLVAEVTTSKNSMSQSSDLLCQKFTEEIEILKEKLQALSVNLTESTSLYEKQSEELIKLNSERDELKVKDVELSQALQESAQLKSEQNSLLSDLKEFKEKNLKLQKLLDDLHTVQKESDGLKQKEKECYQLNQVIVQLRQQLQNKQGAFGETDSLKAELALKIKELDDVIEREASLACESKALEEMIDSLSDHNKSQQEKISMLEIEMHKKTEECEQLNILILELRSQLENRTVEEVTKVEENGVANRAEIEKLQQELFGQQLKYSELEVRISTITSLEKELSSYREKEKENHHLLSLSENQKYEIDQLTSLLESAKSKCSSLEGQANRALELDALVLDLQTKQSNEREKFNYDINMLTDKLQKAELLASDTRKREEASLAEVKASEELVKGLRQSLDDMSKLQQQSLLNAATGEASKLQAMTAHLQKMETENKQLHQVILQLRNVRKVSKEDVDGLLLERDELKKSCESLKIENAQLAEKLRVQDQAVQSAGKAQADLNALQDKLLEYEEARQGGMQIIDEKKREIARLEKLIYDSQVAAEAATADIRILNQDLSRKELELQNLHKALSATETEQEHNRRLLQNEFERKLSAMETKFKAEVLESGSLWEHKLNETLAKSKSTEQLLQDAKILQRKAELDLAAEKKKMQKTVESAISQLRNKEDDVVDRALIANLLVSYFKRQRSREVMDLLAKVLNFNDDQKVAVGLKVGSIGFRHAVGNIFKTIVGTSPTKSIQEIEGENLAELWVNFLMTETGDDGANGISKSPLAIRKRISGIGSSESDNDNSDHESEAFGTISLTPPSPTIAKSSFK